METTAHPKSAKDKTCSRLVLILLLFPLISSSPHMPKQLTWEVLSQTGDVVWTITQTHAPNTWWPSLTPKICDLIVGSDIWDIPMYTYTNRPQSLGTVHLVKRAIHTGITSQGQHIADNPSCKDEPARRKLRQTPFYVCPRDGRDASTAYKCGGLESFYCKKMGM